MRPLGEDEWAVRFTEKELEGWWAKEVVVREGYLALLFLDGRLDRVLSPGTYTLGSFWQALLRRGPKKEVVLVRSGEVPLKFTLPQLLTADPLFVEVECAVVLRLRRGEESAFYTHLMGEKGRVTLLDLRSLVFPALRDGAFTWLGERTLEQLVAEDGLTDLVMKLESEVERALLGKGVEVVRVEVRPPRCMAWDERTRKLAEGLEEVWREETELERRKRLARVKEALALQEIEEETSRLSHFQKRAELWERLRRALQQAEMSRLRDEGELEDFVRSLDRERLLKEDDLERFKRTLRERREDEEKARAHLVRLAELERDYEYRMLELRKRRDLTAAEMEFQQGMERLRLQGQYERERMALDFQVEKARKEAERRLAERQAEEALRRAMELEEAKTQAQIRGLEREARRLDEEARLALRERELALQRADEAERQRLRWEAEERHLEQELKRKRAELEMHLERLEREHRLERERLAALGQMPITALIHVADPAKAPLLADLAALEIKKGMTFEQIVALAAEKDPQVLSYLERAQTSQPLSEEEKRLYERILGEQKEFQSRMSEFYREALEMQRRMHEKALEAVADVARALGRPAPSPVVPPPPPAPGDPPGQGVCPRCRQIAPTPAGCPNCGTIARDRGGR
jgi:hypothetical protein